VIPAAAFLVAALPAVETLDGAAVAIDPAQGKATVVVFLSVVCPYSNDYHERYERLWTEPGGRGVAFYFVYSNRTEDRAAVARHAREARFPFPVYRDRDNRLADHLQARFTPSVYVLDASGAVRYSGKIDDHLNPARVKRKYTREAVEALLAGRAPAVTATEAFG
jgi:protein-disulfide isomerase